MAFIKPRKPVNEFLLASFVFFKATVPGLDLACVTEAKRALPRLKGSKECVLLEQRLALVEAAAILNRADISEHTLVQNLTLLRDHTEEFPIFLQLKVTESLVRFRLQRVFNMETDEALAAIEALIESFCLWDTDDSMELMSFKLPSFQPVWRNLMSAKSKDGPGLLTEANLFGDLLEEQPAGQAAAAAVCLSDLEACVCQTEVALTLTELWTYLRTYSPICVLHCLCQTAHVVMI